MHVGKNKASIELYKKRVLEYPDDPDEYLLLIKVYLYADQVEEAKKAINAVKKSVMMKSNTFVSPVTYTPDWGKQKKHLNAGKSRS